MRTNNERLKSEESKVFFFMIPSKAFMIAKIKSIKTIKAQ
jgi:hypothetical protein